MNLKKQDDADKLSKALNRFREDPTFHVRLDEESSETIISGTERAHLEIYAERIKREYNCEIDLGRPKVAYRETVTDVPSTTSTRSKPVVPASTATSSASLVW